MTRYRLVMIGALAAIVTLLVACGGYSPSDSMSLPSDSASLPGDITGLPRPLTQAEVALVQADNAFALKVFHAIADSAGPEANLFISPLSASVALAIAYNGAAGTTQLEMQHVLALEGLTLDDVNRSNRSLIALLRSLDSRVVFKLANSVWYRQEFTLLPDFLSATRTYFDATVQGLDFANPNAAATIDSWVSNETQGKIPTIAPDPIPDDVVACLINAIHFQGGWATEFDKTRTQPSPFYLRSGSQTTVSMMSQAEGVYVRYLFDGGVRVIDLPYGGGAFSMTILLPRDAGGIDSLLPALTGERWRMWTAALDPERATVTGIIYLPKFVLTYGLSMNGVLRALGMPSAFDCRGASNFTRMAMVPAGLLCISDVRHKATVDVTEQGTDAAAATPIYPRLVSAPATLRVDHPFVFVIRERFSGTILFMGRVMSPG